MTPPRARASAAVSAIADTPAAVGLGALLPAFAADVAARHAAGAEGRSRGPRTALALLDQALGGVLPRLLGWRVDSQGALLARGRPRHVLDALGRAQ